jgi:ubiquinone/menaquinone biosynthesis C-methylase UbiE
MVDHKRTYKKQAEQYELLVSREDHQGNLLPAIQQCVDLSGKTIVDLGAGTGRVTRLVAPFSKKTIAFDLSHAMLRVAKGNHPDHKDDMLLFAAADHRNLPVANEFADVVIAGWSFCYLADWYPKTWRSELQRGIVEIERVLKRNGTIVIIETQGTGFENPHPPPHLIDYFSFLVEKGFKSKWIRTDYRFRSLDEALEISKFFFGDELAEQVARNKWVVLPECTGIWYRSES